MNLKLGRRNFVFSLGALAGLFGSSKLDALAATPKHVGSMSSPGLPLVDGHAIVPITKGLCSTGDPWAELGVAPMVNIQGTVTVIGGSVMRPEVMEAIRIGNMHFCVIDDLLVKSGKWLANLCKAPEGYTALVTEGCAAAILCCYAGMLTEDYNERMQNIPDLRGFPKTEVIIQQGHRDNFDHQVRQTGVKLVVVETRDELVAAINERTLGIHFNHIQSNRGQVPAEEVIAIAKAHNIYTFCDASADVPPKERLWELPALGFDFVAFSGGKDICGPQATGFVIGKENMVRWAMLNMSPQENRIGRVCKVSKESLFGLLKAVELFVNQDYDETLKKYDDRAATITNALKKYGVTMERTYNGEALGNVSPHYTWTFDAEKVKLTNADIMQKLGETKPVAIGSPPGLGMGAGGASGRPDPNWNGPNDSAGGGGGGRGRGGRGGAGGGGAAGGTARGDEVARAPGATAPGAPPVPEGAGGRGGRGGGGGRGGAPNTFGFSTWLLKDGEDKYIANRLVEIFSEAAAGNSAATSGKAPAAKKS
ncbi:MAG TPA: aminotransferase class V-fold PLP-dependent enzyme [Candidatus Acidoferrales bacterium]